MLCLDQHPWELKTFFEQDDKMIEETGRCSSPRAHEKPLPAKTPYRWLIFLTPRPEKNGESGEHLPFVVTNLGGEIGAKRPAHHDRRASSDPDPQLIDAL